MIQIDNVGADPRQLFELPLADGTVITLELTYRPASERWTVDVTREGFTARGIDLGLSPNFLRSWRDTVPFGMACTATDDQDPVYLDDFTSGRVALFLLDADDVAQVEAGIMGAP